MEMPGKSHLGFQTQLVLASIVSGLGMTTDSETTIIGSMLISPIGGVIIDFADITNHNETDDKKKKKIFRKIIECLLIPFVIGYFIGLITGAFRKDHSELYSYNALNARGYGLYKDPQYLAISATIAACGGAAIETITKGGDTPAIGVGIATALLPPIVAAGFISGMISVGYGNGPQYSEEDKHYFSGQAVGFALCNFAVNAIVIYIAVTIIGKLNRSARVNEQKREEKEALEREIELQNVANASKVATEAATNAEKAANDAQQARDETQESKKRRVGGGPTRDQRREQRRIIKLKERNERANAQLREVRRAKEEKEKILKETQVALSASKQNNPPPPDLSRSITK